MPFNKIATQFREGYQIAGHNTTYSCTVKHFTIVYFVSSQHYHLASYFILAYNLFHLFHYVTYESQTILVTNSSYFTSCFFTPHHLLHRVTFESQTILVTIHYTIHHILCIHYFTYSYLGLKFHLWHLNLKYCVSSLHIFSSLAQSFASLHLFPYFISFTISFPFISFHHIFHWYISFHHTAFIHFVTSTSTTIILNK